MTRTLVAVPLVSAQIYRPGAAQPFEGRAVRFEVGYRRAPCDLPGPVDVSELGGDGSDEAKVTAHVWRASPGCGDATVLELRVIPLRDDSEILYSVFDASTGKLAASFRLPGPADFSRCNAGPLPLGQTCVNDCQCSAAGADVRCVPVTDTAGVCAIPCGEDVDCPASLPRCSSEAQGRTCVGAGEDCSCPPDDVCGFGQSCVGCACAVTRSPASYDRACACDADCGAGAICTSGRCALPCETVSDCLPHFEFCNGGRCLPAQ